jgi:lysophospholipase L1-like esterase
VRLGLALLAAGALAAPAQAADGTRVTVALFGDSTAEGYQLPHLRDTLAPRLLDQLVARGFERGATGLIPAMPRRWQFNRASGPDASAPPPGGWQMVGYGGRAGVAGPSGYAAYTRSPGASATTAVDGTQVGVLYEAGSIGVPFQVTAGGASWTIDPRAEPAGPAATWLELPPGTASVTVHGPDTAGPMAFDGAVVHRPPSPGRVQVEVQNLAHTGHQPDIDLAPRVVQALRMQRYDISVLLYGPIAEQGADAHAKDPVYRRYRDALRARAEIARGAGGLCLVADAFPLRVPPRVTRAFTAFHKRFAAQAGCAYTGALRNLWKPAAAHRQGLLILDDVHPTAKGYRRIARALAPKVAQMVRGRATSAAAAR